jgi:glycosyltransferase involved in cell wall biosynthesis
MRPTIFLVNQISKHGHLDLYARLYSACLLALGFKVVLIAEHESGVHDWLASNDVKNRDDFVFFKRDELRDTPQNVQSAAGEIIPPMLTRISRVWRKEGFYGIALRCSFYVRGFLLRRASFFLRRALSFGRRRWRAGYEAIAARFRNAVGINFAPIVDEILIAEKRIGVRPALVLFLYLDMMSDDRKGCRQLANRLDAPWAGILFHPRYMGRRRGAPLERYFRCRNARGAAFLNPHCVPPYSKSLPALRFGVLPDVTDAVVASHEVALVSRLRARANGRTIVLLIGSLSPHKGLIPLIEVIRRADPERFFFAIIGEVFWESYGDREQDLRAFTANLPENCLFETKYIEDEGELNAVIAASDILYAVYAEFRDSSNSLTKAANLEIPLLVSDEYLMGERVEHYKLGEAVRYGDIDGILAALQALRDRPRNAFGFDAYRKDHSMEVLQKGLNDLIVQWLSPGC